MAPRKKRGESVADKIAARNRAAVMDTTGTGDASMDRVLMKETGRRAAFASTVGTTSRAASENSLVSTLRRMFGKKKKGV